MKYEYLEHTADAKFRAYGNSLDETFTNAALAMMGIMVDTSKVQETKTRNIAASGKDLKSLLQNFLEQFLIVMDAENIFLTTIKKIKIERTTNEYALKAEARGDDAGKYETIGPQVKAATYNDMIAKEKMAQVVLDI